MKVISRDPAPDISVSHDSPSICNSLVVNESLSRKLRSPMNLTRLVTAQGRHLESDERNPRAMDVQQSRVADTRINLFDKIPLSRARPGKRPRSRHWCRMHSSLLNARITSVANGLRRSCSSGSLLVTYRVACSCNSDHTMLCRSRDR